jgi:hydrogenase maturation protease
MARVLVACLGSGLAGDCAAGSAVHSLLSGCTLPEGSRLALVRSGALELFHQLDGHEVLVAIDEVETGAAPGTVHVLDWQEVPIGGEAGARRWHPLRVAIEAARIRDPERLPRRAFLVGIEGRGYGGHEGGLHNEVASALAGAARAALDLAYGLAGLEGAGLVDVEKIERASTFRPIQRASSTMLPIPAEAH